MPGGMVCAIDLITGFGYICGMAENQAGTVWHPTLLDQVDSTQDWVRRNLSHLPDRSVVTACSQSVGKGRLGRGWVSPPGGLYSSILFRPAPVPEFAPRVSLAMAAVLVRSLQSSGVPSLVKWPNDVLAGGGKIAGIIAEAGGHPEPWLILGVGVNLSCAPVVPGRSILPAVHWGAFASPPEPTVLLDELLSGLCELWPSCEADPLLFSHGIISGSLWMKGSPVSFHSGRERFTGVLRGIAHDGGLILELNTGERVFHSGELFPV